MILKRLHIPPPHFYLFNCLLCFAFSFFPLGLLAQNNDKDIIQINGVTMTADSLRAVPGVVVAVKGQNRGVVSSNLGVFSIVIYKGDTLEFDALGFRGKEYVVAKNIQGEYLSMIQLMVQDTFYLPETIIRPYKTRAEFEYEFKNNPIPDDQLEIARRNTDAYTLRALAFVLPKDGHESQSSYLQQQAINNIYYGQQKPMNIFNPLAWAEFFDAWKRGDFRKKR